MKTPRGDFVPRPRVDRYGEFFLPFLIFAAAIERRTVFGKKRSLLRRAAKIFGSPLGMLFLPNQTDTGSATTQ
jgi:hypothetical protein